MATWTRKILLVTSAAHEGSHAVIRQMWASHVQDDLKFQASAGSMRGSEGLAMAYPAFGKSAFLQDMLQSLAGQGRDIVVRAFGQSFSRAIEGQSLDALLDSLLDGRGEASSVAIAREIMNRYAALDSAGKSRFLQSFATRFAPDPEAIRDAFRKFDADPSSRNLRALTNAVEPPRQEVIRRLNRAPGNTLNLVRMREDLLDATSRNPDLADVDADFQHLFSSWFNRGFLVLRRIDWASPAHILEKIIRYEAVHAIESWDDLRRRLQPPDRRCFAFFHPALVDEPLIFVEVALTRDIPDAIQPILAADRIAATAESATTAVFYSISNCQRGLAKISFGNFLIKQVAEELKQECPGLSTFVTLSPVPGFREWVEKEAQQHDGLNAGERETLAALCSLPVCEPADIRAAEPALRNALAIYMLQARSGSNRPRDAVERFHLGNGARLERLNLGADLSRKGIAESFGAMVNYLYDLPLVEANHERYAQQGEIVVSAAIQRQFPHLMARSAVRSS
jgi:malonyl-CoA decarboxylase